MVDLQRKLVFVANDDGTDAHRRGGAPLFAVRGPLNTMPRDRTVTHDPATHNLYLESPEVAPT